MWRPIVARVRGLLLHPRSELPTTLADPGEARGVLWPYVVVLAAVGPVGLFLVEGILGVYHPPTSIFNTVIPGGWLRAPDTAALGALTTFALSIGAWAVLDQALLFLAPRFGGLRDPKGAHKAAAYTLTPVWAAGALVVLQALPYLGFLWSLGLIAALAYAVWIGRLAVPLHLGTPDERAAGHVLLALAITVAVVAIGYFSLSAAMEAVSPRLS